MKFKLPLLILLSICLLPFSLIAQVKFSGSLQSSLYSWETLDQSQRMDFYQGLQLRLSPEKNPNLAFSTYLRLGRTGDPADWQEKVYNMSLLWQIKQKRLRFQLGRQFLFSGVMNGTIDGLLVSASLTKNMELKLLGGLEAPLQRKLELRQWDEGNVFGGYLSYRFLGQTRVDLSYFQKARHNQTVWQQLGTAVNGKLSPELYYQAQLDFNLLASSLQTLRGRLTYFHQKWSLTAEFNSQAPRVYEDSYFKVFELQAANQIRTGVTYQLKPVQLGLQYLLTLFEAESNNQLLVTIGSRWGLVGLIFQNGFGGDNLGVYGEVQYPIIQHLTLRLYSSYYNYQRHTVDISEDATAFSGGLQYRLDNSLLVQADLQESANSYYKNDLRGLFRLNYFFNN